MQNSTAPVFLPKLIFRKKGFSSEIKGYLLTINSGHLLSLAYNWLAVPVAEKDIYMLCVSVKKLVCINCELRAGVITISLCSGNRNLECEYLLGSLSQRTGNMLIGYI